MDIDRILREHNELSEDNDWQVYHTPKNLATALSVQAAQVLKHFQWITEEESLTLGRLSDRKNILADEIADTFFCLLSLSSKLGINLEQAIEEKAAKNQELYQGAPDEDL